MTSLTRRAPALLLALLIAVAGSLLWAAPAKAATPSATISYTASTAPIRLVVATTPGTNASLTYSSHAVTSGDTVSFTSPLLSSVTVKSRQVAGDKAWNYSARSTSLAPASRVFSGAGTYAFEVVGTDNNGSGSGTATGTITVEPAPVAAPTSHPATSAPGAHPTATPTHSATTGGSGGTSGSGGGSGGTIGGSGGGGGAKSSSGGGTPVTPATTPPSDFGGFGPGGFAPGNFGTLAPEAGNGGAVLPPVIAPYATVTGPDGVPSTLYTTYTPTPSPVAAVSLGSGGGGSGRAIGLTGAITAVLLVGLLASFGRLLLAHPAAANRRH